MREAGAPCPIAVTLRPLSDLDRGRVRGWLARPDVSGWWAPPSTVSARLAIVLDSSSALARVIEGDGVAIGYADALESEAGGGRPVTSAAAALDEAAGSWELAAFIADEALRGRGLGAEALRLLADELFGTTLALGAFVRVPVRSERAARAIEAAGFRWHRIDRSAVGDPAWILARERPGGAQRRS